MDEQSSLSRGHIAWLRGLAKLYRRIVGGACGCKRMAAHVADAGVRRDIGLGDHHPRGVGDMRQAFYRRLLERGQPLP